MNTSHRYSPLLAPSSFFGFPVALSLVISGLASTTHAAISIDANSWAAGAGAPLPALSGQTATGLVWGNGAAGNSDNTAVHATIDGDTGTMGNQQVNILVGQTLIFSGRLDLQSTITTTIAPDQLRVGLYNSNSSMNNTGWLGYMFTSATNTGPGRILERDNPNTGNYFSINGSTAATGTGADTALTAGSNLITAGFYNYTLSLKRVAAGMEINSSLIRESDSVDFSARTAPFLDTTPQTFIYDRIAFLASGSLDSDQITLSNTSLTLIPEPSTALLGGLGLLALLRRRRD